MPGIEAELLKARLGHNARVQVAGVVVPGILLLVEGWLLVTGTDTPLHTASERTTGINSWVLVFTGLVILLAALLLGLAARGLAWPVYRHTVGSESALSVARARDGLRDVYGERVDVVLDDDPASAAAFALRDVDAVRSYCKYWLRLRQPALGIDDYEVEIALLVSLTLPLLALPGTLLRAEGTPWRSGGWWDAGWAAAAVLLGAFLVWLAFHRTTQRRREELAAALRNYYLARCFARES